jgi:hypothetical protein
MEVQPDFISITEAPAILDARRSSCEKKSNLAAC